MLDFCLLDGIYYPNREYQYPLWLYGVFEAAVILKTLIFTNKGSQLTPWLNAKLPARHGA